MTYQKHYTAWLSCFHSRVAGLVQHRQIIKCNTAYYLKQRNKKLLHDCLKRWRKLPGENSKYFVMKVRIIGRCLNIIKAIYNEPIVNIKLSEETLKEFPLSQEWDKRVHSLQTFSTYYWNYSLD
jgi:hypothetical protein